MISTHFSENGWLNLFDRLFVKYNKKERNSNDSYRWQKSTQLRALVN